MEEWKTKLLLYVILSEAKDLETEGRLLGKHNGFRATRRTRVRKKTSRRK